MIFEIGKLLREESEEKKGQNWWIKFKITFQSEDYPILF